MSINPIQIKNMINVVKNNSSLNPYSLQEQGATNYKVDEVPFSVEFKRGL